MTELIVICIALLLLLVVFSIEITYLRYRIDDLETLTGAADTEIEHIERVVRRHTDRLDIHLKDLHDQFNKVEKLEARLHTVEINQNIGVENEK